MNKDKQIMILAGLTILVIVLLPYLNIVPKFAISDSDWTLVEDTGMMTGSYTITNQTINFNISSQNYNVQSGQAFLYYLAVNGTCVDINPTNTYSSFPTLEGTNKICKLVAVIESNDSVRQKTYSTIYTKEIQIQKVAGPTVYINKTVNQTVIVEKKVEVELTFLERYGIAGVIFIVMGLIIIYLIYKRTR